ncbi:MAG: glycoside hydrolase family 32 protein [Clostridiales bacterium]|nr:glycoside hydrolase family 32 protein [Clostridiales bacterium]
MNSGMLRPKIHFTPEKGWMNDPNGLVFYQGKYHLFYQHDPDSLVWDTMHWGHAVSADLIHWEHLPIALYPDDIGVIYSGSCFVDTDNVTGWGTKDSPALLAFYTSHKMETARECQCLAWSTDGLTFHKYEENPIIPGAAHTPARDPQVFRNTILGGYTLIITRETCVEFYHSTDFLSWKKTGEFNLPEYALHGMIECPCMFCSEGKYVLILSMDVPESEFCKFPEEAVPHARVMQYFIGGFDGRCFSADLSQNEVLLVDYGPDFYAGTIFSNVKDTIFMAWLGDFSNGARNTPTEKEGFRGIQCFPRKLTLVQTEKGKRLYHEFIPIRKEDLPDGVILSNSSNGIRLVDGCVSESISKSGIMSRTSYIEK